MKVLRGKFLLAMVGVFLSPETFAGEIDILVRKLVEKGILTPGEAQQILIETREELRKEMAKGEVEGIPRWIQKMKIKGDFRLRYQWQDKEGKPERNRARIRLRLGAITQPADNWEVGFGLATGGDDPRSTNETLDDAFESPDIRLDYAYAEYQGLPNLLIWGGKYKGIKEAIWRPSDLLWDSDLRPEGVGVKFKYQALFLNAGLWILDEVKQGADPLMVYFQPGLKFKLSENVDVKLASAYYAVSSVKGHTLEHSSGTNTLEGGGLKYDYDVIASSWEISFKQPFPPFPYLGIFCDYVYNPDPEEDNKGYLIGVKLGDKKVKKFGDWQFKYMYRRLEKDAWLDVFPDSDAYGGATGVKGHEFLFKLGLAENLTLGLDCYHMKEISGSGKEDLLQVDLIWKF